MFLLLLYSIFILFLEQANTFNKLMETTIIIIFCCILLIAYIFDISSSKTRIPSVILLLLFGLLLKKASVFLKLEIPDISPLLPILGSLGLILIVLDGALDIELNKSKIIIFKKAIIGSVLITLSLGLIFTLLFYYYSPNNLKDCLINAIPFCIISSAIAIPSVQNLSNFNREFVVCESSLSDIFGVIFFNFIAYNEVIDLKAFGNFGLEIITIILISFIATIGLSLILKSIGHHVKFVPIILLIVLVYEISKIWHLPGLVFILIFGVIMGNLDELNHFKWINKFNPVGLNNEVKKFKELSVEATFLVRSSFFIVFGYLMKIEEIFNVSTIFWAIAIVAIIFLFRIIQLKISKIPLNPLVFVAPRGLITVLLFLLIAPSQQIVLVNKSLIIQVIILSALCMMFGFMFVKSEKKAA
jgi:Kef-type K+ transport system membrane component KefB